VLTPASSAVSRRGSVWVEAVESGVSSRLREPPNESGFVRLGAAERPSHSSSAHPINVNLAVVALRSAPRMQTAWAEE
jgi:hypothetical protein